MEVLFASIVNNRFDSDPKRWRVIAAVSLDGSVVLQSITPIFPTMFLPLAALANMGMNVSWLASSASRAGIHLSFAQASKLADITAKSGSQTTLASTLGMAVGVGISPLVGSSPETIVPCLACISLMHLGCVLRSLQSVALNTLNPQRTDLIAASYIQSTVSAGKEAGAEPRLPSIDEVAGHEVVIGRFAKHLVRGYVSNLPGCLSIGIHSGGGQVLCHRDRIDGATSHHREPARSVRSLSAPAGGANVALLLEKDATPHQVLAGHLQATYLRMALGGMLDDQQSVSDSAHAAILAEQFVDDHGSAYIRALETANWNIDNLFLEQAGGRIEVVC